MKRFQILALVALSLIVGCQYDDPLVEESTLPIDPLILGTWEPVSEDGKKPGKDERMAVLKLSDTEYIVNYPTGNGFCYRAYPIQVGETSCIQLQVLIGDDQEDRKGRELFQVVSYQLTGNELEVRILNEDLISPSLKGTESLEKAFLTHQNSKDLFTDPEKFRRLKSD